MSTIVPLGLDESVLKPKKKPLNERVRELGKKLRRDFVMWRIGLLLGAKKAIWRDMTRLRRSSQADSVEAAILIEIYQEDLGDLDRRIQRLYSSLSR